MSRLRDNLKAFESDLDRLKNVLDILKLVKDFGGSQPPNSGSKTETWDDAAQLWLSVQGHHANLPLASGATLLYLAGRFEYFVRTTIEIAAEDLSEKCSSYSQLPERLRIELLQGLGYALQKQNPRGPNSEAELLIGEMQQCISSNGSISGMLSKYLSATEKNLRQDELASLTKRIGMTDFWAKVGKQTEMKFYFSQESDSEITKLAQKRLDAIMEARNQIAHPTGNVTFPDSDKVIADIEFVLVLSKVLLSNVELYVTAFQPVTNP